MPKSTVTWLRPRDPTIYTDAAALNDIHALLTPPPPAALRRCWLTSG